MNPAPLNKAEYDLKPHATDLRVNLDKAHAPTDTRTGYVSAPKKGKIFSSKELRAAYQQASEKFGWDGRPLELRWNLPWTAS